MVEKAAAWASKAWLRFCSTEYSCMKPFTRDGLHHSASASAAARVSLCTAGRLLHADLVSLHNGGTALYLQQQQQ